MIISQINSIQQPKYFNRDIQQQKQPLLHLNSSAITSNYTSENVKANFIPNFGAFRTVGRTTLLDKETLKEVPVDIKRERIGDYTEFRIMVGRKKVGYLGMTSNATYPFPDHIIRRQNDNIPKVKYLRSIDGEKYAGIGTALIKAAISESLSKKQDGDLWLVSTKGFGCQDSSYRRNENPIPFYYKIGFVSKNKDENQYIKECLNAKRYDKLPDIAVLILSTKARNKWLEELDKNPIIKTGTYF